MIHTINKLSCLLLLFCLTAVPAVWAGSDAAVVPENRIPWSGYWWPRSEGSLVQGYSEHPAPMEKYDAYVSGYYPAEVMTKAFAREYDPGALPWSGYCDAWAAAAILEHEPATAGQLKGIPFAVGDKKGLLTAFYDENYIPVLYGTRYNGNGDDSDDIFPGGVDGFHQILINYIAIQGLPIIMDDDPGIEIWSYPVYRYEMEWTDSNNTRHVTCTVWMADDFVSPDFTGTKSLTKTYTYDLAIDGTGELMDEPGRWTGASVDDHPDFLWFPGAVGSDHPYLDYDTVREIVDSGADGSDDIFEFNNSLADAYAIDGLARDKFYWASAQDEDWYRVALTQGDYFYAFILSPSDSLDVDVFDPQGKPVGASFYHGSRITSVGVSGYYYVRVLSETFDGSYYNIEFFTSPSDAIPHVAVTGGWDTSVTLVGREWYFDQVRLNVFDTNKALLDQATFVVPEHDRVSTSLNTLFGANAHSGGSAGLTNLDANHSPYGFYSYRHSDRLANIPFGVSAAQQLYLPHLRSHNGWYTGVAVMNEHRVENASVRMTAYRADGAVAAESQFSLAPGQSRVGFAETFGSLPDDTDWVAFSSDHQLQGIVLWNRDAGGTDKGLAGIPLLREQHSDRTLFLAHLADSGSWNTDAVILNPNTKSTAITVTGYDAAGNAAASRSFAIGANGCWNGPARDLLGIDGSEGVVWIKIQASLNVCGYQLLARGQDSLVASPLLAAAQMKTEHRLKMIPDSATAWTGLVLLNDGPSKNDVWAIACDAQGNNLLGSQYLWYNAPVGLGAASNAVGFLETIFPGIPPETVTLKILSDEPITGFAIYADESKGQVDVLYLD